MGATYNGVNLGAMRRSAVAGANSATSIAVTGITTSDKLVAVIVSDGDGILSTYDQLDGNDGTFTIDSAGNIKSATVSTASKKLLVEWWDVSEAEA